MKLTKADYPVIDLRANFGDRYRVKRDDCGDQLIGHQWGHVYAHSATELACVIEGNNKINRIQRQFPEICITKRGDSEIVFLFDPALFPKLAKALKASRKRQVSEVERKRLADMGRAHRFKHGHHGYKERNLEKSGDFSVSEGSGMSRE